MHAGREKHRRVVHELRSRMASLRKRERILLAGVVTLATVYAVVFLVEALLIEPRRQLATEVARAEREFEHHRQLLALEESIHAQYRELETPHAASGDSVLTETAVLRALSALAGPHVHVKSLVPRLEDRGGASVIWVTLDFEGPFDDVVGYVAQVLDRMPSEIDNLSLAAVTGNVSAVVCRMSMRVGEGGD